MAESFLGLPTIQFKGKELIKESKYACLLNLVILIPFFPCCPLEKRITGEREKRESK